MDDCRNIIKELEESLISKSYEIKTLYKRLSEKEDATKKIINDLTLKINNLEKVSKIDRIIKEKKTVASIDNNKQIVKRESLDDFL